MKKKFLVGLLAIVMCFALVGCGKTESESGGSSNGESINNGGSNTSEKSNIEGLDSMKTFEKSVGVDCSKMFSNVFAVNGQLVSKKYSFFFLFKSEKNESARKTELENLNKYLKSVSKDGKLYSDVNLSKEFDGTFEDENLGEFFYIQIGEKKWEVTVAYNTHAYTDGTSYPCFDVWFERITD